MNNEQYRVWSDNFSQSEDNCDLIMAYDHESAATAYAENKHNEEAYSDAVRIHVRCTFGGDDGELRVYTVHPEPTVDFYAYED